jgi:hypothetical protein
MADMDDDLGDRGTTRGGGTPVKVVVKSGGVAVHGITVNASMSGSGTVSETTGSNGVASFTLAAGKYKVTASNNSGSATASVTVVESTTTEIVPLALVPNAS